MSKLKIKTKEGVAGMKKVHCLSGYTPLWRALFFVKHFSLKRASEFPVFVKGISLLSAGHSYASRRMRACSIR